MSVSVKHVETPQSAVGVTARRGTWVAEHALNRPFIGMLAYGRPRSTGGSCRR